MEYEDYDEGDEYRHHPTDRIPPLGGDGNMNECSPQISQLADCDNTPFPGASCTAPAQRSQHTGYSCYNGTK